EPAHRGGELRTLGRTEDDAAMINQVVDREDVGLVVDRYCKPADDGLPEQAPRFRSAENRHRLTSAVTHVSRVARRTGLVSAEGPLLPLAVGAQPGGRVGRDYEACVGR